MKISMQLVYQYIAIFFNFSTTSNHLHPLQVANCDSNLRLEVDEDDNGKFRLERVKLWEQKKQIIQSRERAVLSRRNDILVESLSHDIKSLMLSCALLVNCIPCFVMFS